MSNDLRSLSQQWWAEARQKSAEDQAEIDAWKDEKRDEQLLGPRTFWDFVDAFSSGRYERHWQDRYDRKWGKK
jgi:hypothetical protein